MKKIFILAFHDFHVTARYLYLICLTYLLFGVSFLVFAKNTLQQFFLLYFIVNMMGLVFVAGIFLTLLAIESKWRIPRAIKAFPIDGKTVFYGKTMFFLGLFLGTTYLPTVLLLFFYHEQLERISSQIHLPFFKLVFFYLTTPALTSTLLLTVVGVIALLTSKKGKKVFSVTLYTLMAVILAGRYFRLGELFISLCDNAQESLLIIIQNPENWNAVPALNLLLLLLTLGLLSGGFLMYQRKTQYNRYG